MPPVRRVASLLFCTLFLLPSASGAAQEERRGTIKGEVVESGSGDPQADAEVTLMASDSSGRPLFSRNLTTGEDGLFRFGDLPVGDETVYTVDAEFDGGTFAGGALRLPANTTKPPVITSTLRVTETTSDPAVLLIRRDNIFIVPNEDGGLGVIESVTVINDSNRAYIGRGAAMGSTREGPQPTLGLSLPPDARDGDFGIVRADLDIPQIVRTDFGFAPTVAIPPGDFNIIYSYELDGEGGIYDFSRNALYPVLELSVFVTDELEVDSNRLVSEGPETVGGRAYTKWTASDYLDPGDTIALNITDSGGGSALTVVAAAAAAGLFLLTMVGYVLARRRRRSQAKSGPSRDELLHAIAELDVRKESGDLSQEDWATERNRLKRELQTTQSGASR